LLAQLWKELCNHIVSGQSLPISSFKELFSNHAACVDEEISRARHIQKLTRALGIQDVVCTNNPGIGICEQGEIDFAAIREVLQDGFAVVANRCEFHSLLVESCFCNLQLNQLRFAVWSPIRRAEEEQNGAVRPL